MKMAAARDVSGRRGGRLLPLWPERATSRWPSVDRQLARLLEARGVSGLHGHGIAESGRSGQRDHGPSVGEAGGGPRYVRASVVMALPKGAGAGSDAVGG
jgi:hypothetical protein